MSLVSDEIGKRMVDSLSESFESLLLQDNNIEKIDKIDDVVSWIKQQSESAAKDSDSSESLDVDRDKILSKISNKIIEQLIQYVPQYMGQMIVENIEIKTKGKEKSVKFDLGFVLDPIKPYVEIVKKVNEVDTVKIKTEFQLDSDVKLLDIKLTINDEKKRILSLGNMVVHIKITLITSGTISAEKILNKSQFEADLSDLKLTLS